MDPCALKDVNGASKRRGDRRDKDGVAPVVELFDDKGRDQSVFDLSQRRLPRLFAPCSGKLSSKAPDDRITWNSLEDVRFYPLPDQPSGPSAHGNADQEADKEHEE